MMVVYQGHLYRTYLPYCMIRIPFRYLATLYVEGIPTGIQAIVWGRKRADAVLHELIEHGNELIHRHGLIGQLAAEIYSRRREEAMAKIQVGDKVRLLVDIGQFKKGRVCKVVEVAEPTLYRGRGGHEWEDDRYPVKVLPVSMSGDGMVLGPKDAIPLATGEFGPIDWEVE